MFLVLWSGFWGFFCHCCFSVLFVFCYYFYVMWLHTDLTISSLWCMTLVHSWKCVACFSIMLKFSSCFAWLMRLLFAFIVTALLRNSLTSCAAFYSIICIFMDSILSKRKINAKCFIVYIISQ